jgi:hypothetical protein
MGKNLKHYPVHPVHPCSFLHLALPELDPTGDARMEGGGWKQERRDRPAPPVRSASNGRENGM